MYDTDPESILLRMNHSFDRENFKEDPKTGEMISLPKTHFACEVITKSTKDGKRVMWHTTCSAYPYLRMMACFKGDEDELQNWNNILIADGALLTPWQDVKVVYQQEEKPPLWRRLLGMT